MAKLFLDTEFTGLHQCTSLISLALVAEDGCEFYAECNDFSFNETSATARKWIEDHVLVHLEFKEKTQHRTQTGPTLKLKGNREYVRDELTQWLKQFESIEVWGDVLAYDWVLFCDLFGGALGIPENIFYAPFDLATAFRLKGWIEPHSKYERDVKRFEFAGIGTDLQHHALTDARVEKICFEKLLSL
jgi:hypothetical protein